MTISPCGGTVLTDATGSFTFASVADGSYTVTPALSGYNYSPTSAPVTVSGADVTGLSFTALGVSQTHFVGGTVKLNGTTPLANVTMTLTPGGITTTTNGSGAYGFAAVSAGSYTVTPTLANTASRLPASRRW